MGQSRYGAHQDYNKTELAIYTFTQDKISNSKCSTKINYSCPWKGHYQELHNCVQYIFPLLSNL